MNGDIPWPPPRVKGGFRKAWRRGYAAALASESRTSPYKIGVWRFYFRLGYDAGAKASLSGARPEGRET